MSTNKEMLANAEKKLAKLEASYKKNSKNKQHAARSSGPLKEGKMKSLYNCMKEVKARMAEMGFDHDEYVIAQGSEKMFFCEVYAYLDITQWKEQNPCDKDGFWIHYEPWHGLPCIENKDGEFHKAVPINRLTGYFLTPEEVVRRTR